MAKSKKVLILMLALTVIVGAIAKLAPSDSSEFWLTWQWVVPMLLGVSTVLYAYMQRCNSCGAQQVFRSMSFFDIRFPGKKCWTCSALLESEDGGNAST